MGGAFRKDQAGRESRPQTGECEQFLGSGCRAVPGVWDLPEVIRAGDSGPEPESCKEVRGVGSGWAGLHLGGVSWVSSLPSPGTGHPWESAGPRMSKLQKDRKEDMTNTGRDHVAFQVLIGCLVGVEGQGWGTPASFGRTFAIVFARQQASFSLFQGQGAPGVL